MYNFISPYNIEVCNMGFNCLSQRGQMTTLLILAPSYT